MSAGAGSISARDADVPRGQSIASWSLREESRRSLAPPDLVVGAYRGGKSLEEWRPHPLGETRDRGVVDSAVLLGGSNKRSTCVAARYRRAAAEGVPWRAASSRAASWRSGGHFAQACATEPQRAASRLPS